MLALGITAYLIVCIIVAVLLRNSKAGFFMMLLMCIYLTPYIVAIAGLLFAKRSS